MHNAQLRCPPLADGCPFGLIWVAKMLIIGDFAGGERPNGHIIAEGNTIIVHCALCIVHWIAKLQFVSDVEFLHIIKPYAAEAAAD